MHVLVRPRGGGFVYEADELDTIARDIRTAIALGADGVVVGALTAAGELDLEAIARFIDAAGDADVTVHRAVDASPARSSVAALAALGVRRVLTSGGAADCRAGLTTLQSMVAASGTSKSWPAAGCASPTSPTSPPPASTRCTSRRGARRPAVGRADRVGESRDST